MARTNYSFEKRSRELDKQKKKEEKRLKKLAEKNAEDADAGELPPSDAIEPSQA